MKTIKRLSIFRIPFLKIVESENAVRYYLFHFLYFMKAKVRRPTPTPQGPGIADRTLDNLLRGDLQELLNAKTDEKTVLVVQNLAFHGEVDPSVVYYFLKMGYTVHAVITRDSNAAYQCFERMKFPSDKFKFFIINSDAILHGLFCKTMLRYRHIMLSTGDWYAHDPYFYHENYTKKYSKENLWNILHVQEALVSRIPNTDISRTFVIHRHPVRGRTLPFLSPTHFGSVKQHEKNPMTIFAIVGKFVSAQRDFSLLTNAIRKLKENGITNFKCVLIGRRELSEYEPDLDGIQEFIDFQGTLTYPQMYAKIDQADFMVSLLSHHNAEHRQKYLVSHTSGAFALSVGFQKPFVISRDYADDYGFDDKNAVIYQEDDLCSGMLAAIKMTQKPYKEMRIQLGKFKEKQEAESLENMIAAFGRA